MTKSNRSASLRGRLMGMGAAGMMAFAVFGYTGEAEAQVNVQRSGPVPDYHVVSSGDTMWDLSGQYYRDNYMWPRMWAYNAHVTNPHWIYPGDIVYLRAPKSGGEEAPIAQQTPQQGAMQLPAAGWVAADRMEYSGRITGSPKEANMMSDHDTVWIGLGEEAYTEEELEDLDEEERRKMKAASPKVGDSYVVVREQGQLEDDEGDVVGHKYRLIGVVTVTEVSEKYYDTAVVRETWIEMERGDYLIPYERQLKATQPVQSDKDRVAKVIDSMAKQRFFGEQHYVFVNQGADDGVRPGNRYFVYHKREGLDFESHDTSEEIPWRRVGQLMLIDVRKNYSLAVITDSVKEIEIGDRLEMYKGF